MRLCLSWMILGILVSATPGATLVAPSSFATTNGNAQGPSPLRFYGAGGSRVQQVYDQSLFSSANHPQLITAIQFRPYNGSPSSLFGDTVNVSNIQINLSTTQHSGEGANPLDATFANNTGLNSTPVYSGPLSLTTGATGPAAGPKDFDYTINLQTPFLYTPSLGNLLVDFQIPVTATVSGNGAFGFLTFDTVNTANDGIFSVLDQNNGAATFGQLSTAGAITKFVTASVPEPSSLILATTSIVILSISALRHRSSKH